MIQEKNRGGPISNRTVGKVIEQNRSESMSKREIIDYIMEINRGAKAEFLAQFPVEELDLYLEHLMEIDLEDMAMCA
jgi:hypothetical protein